MFSVAATSCISLIGGLGIEAVQEKIIPLVPLIIAMPALNTMVGDYAAIIAAHAGNPTENKRSSKELLKAVMKAVWVNIIGVLILSIVLAIKRGYVFEHIFMLKFVCFVTAAMLGIIVVMYAITRTLDKMLENRKLNPDDILIPIVTTITDVMMLGLIALAVALLF